MLTRPWMILSAPRVAWYLPDDMGSWPELEHLSTECVERHLTGSPDGLRRGQTLWAANFELEPGYAPTLHVAWEWTEIRPGVPCLVDPNAILTNVEFLGADGCVLPPLTATSCVTRWVMATPWQELVAMVLAGRSEADGDHRLEVRQAFWQPTERPLLQAPA